jgi:hypothetical protein
MTNGSRETLMKRKAKSSLGNPGLTLSEARTLVRLIARQLAGGEITETHAYNHVADISTLSRHSSMIAHFEHHLRSLGGPNPPKPIPMRLICPGILPDGVTPCATLHLDEGEFATKPHHTHSCQRCGMTWRPAVPNTVGVQFLPGFKNAEPEKKGH